MIVIANKTETRLRMDLRKCLQETPAQKCFYMGFSRAQLERKKLFETFLNVLEELPNSYMAQVYFCQDKDIFILMQGFMQRQFTDFVSKLADAMETPELNEMVEVFEVGVHWTHVEALCDAKIKALEDEKKREEELEQRALEDDAKTAILQKLDPAMVGDVPERRDARKDVKVLIVDDDQLSRTLVGNVLRQDYNLEYAVNGAEALTQYLIHAPDVLFLDIGLPDINGHDVLDCIFQMDPDAYVIMFSGRKDRENIMRALEAGAQGFVGKPFTRNKLYEYIHKSSFVQAKQISGGNVAQGAQ